MDKKVYRVDFLSQGPKRNRGHFLEVCACARARAHACVCVCIILENPEVGRFQQKDPDEAKTQSPAATDVIRGRHSWIYINGTSVGTSHVHTHR